MERGNSLIGFTIVIAIIAVLLGVALGGADILNPYRSMAQAQAIERGSEIQAERDRLALEIQRQEEQIRLEGQRRRQDAELAILHFALAGCPGAADRGHSSICPADAPSGGVTSPADHLSPTGRCCLPG